MRYFDRISGELRFKPRYAWAFWCFAAGMASPYLLHFLLLG